jgi:hypothetical protein
MAATPAIPAIQVQRIRRRRQQRRHADRVSVRRYEAEQRRPMVEGTRLSVAWGTE